MNQAEKIRQFIIKSIKKHPTDIVTVTAECFSVSRTTVLRHIQTLVNQGKVIKTGTTKQIYYTPASALNQSFTFTLNNAFAEYPLFDEYASPIIQKYGNTFCFDICEYILTEILNNAKDHSRGKTVKLSFSIDDKNMHFVCKDNGVGVFLNLQQALGFPDTRTTMLELSKGKLTSDTANHTGEGLFFSARAADIFKLSANGFSFLRDNTVGDWSLYEDKTEPGTTIAFSIERQTSRSLKDLFIAYQDDESLAFSKTEVLIALAKEHGQRLISRSQAKRVVSNLDQFNHVTFDFNNVTIVGQGFVDQLFRVFKNAHPNIEFNYINANDDVTFMIKRSIGQ